MRDPMMLLMLATIMQVSTLALGDDYFDTSNTGDDNMNLCGIYKDGKFGTRIGVNSGEAGYTDYPWMVALFKRTGGRRSCTLEDQTCWTYAAGGTLINMNVVLTAAHNVIGNEANSIKARAGDWDLNSTKELFLYKEQLVKEIIIHSRYRDTSNPLQIKYDAALLILTTPFIQADNIGTICLPQPDREASAKCKIAGWGKESQRSTANYQNILKVTDMEPVGHSQCQRLLSAAEGRRIRLHRSFVCAGGVKDKDSCQGDGGSPLMCLDERDLYYYQRGIVSWGIGCGMQGIPGVYTDVFRIRSWIDDQMVLKGFNSKSYTFVPDEER